MPPPTCCPHLHVQVSSGDVAVVVVGGGAGLCGDQLPGTSRVLRPQFAEVANAVGAALPQVGGRGLG